MKSLIFLTWVTVIPLVRGFRCGFLTQTSSAAARTPFPTLSNPCSLDNVCLLTSPLSPSKARMQSTRLFAIPREEDAIERLLEGVEFDGDTTPEIIRLAPNAKDVDGAMFEDIETGKPSEMMVMKELLGINGFTYLLGALIALLLSLNFFLGPGWMGQAMGIQGVGTFEEVSKSLPDTVDLSRPEFRLDL
ncbi:unnamed protein product [Cylindrotheca closterium]|uniref:Uncharacterized protein n=1 Tax=Cylindrotheca closterium TaxID=2856 RepID=A0AAD2JJ30_9STRA|nr:unnamed protein product [Cylindrotheca closterium]